MWEFRRRPEDQTPEQRAALEALFDELPELGFLHHFRWELTAIFDQAPDREAAEQGIEQMRELAAGSDLDLMPFFQTYDRWREGILAYFDERKTSAAVEGINNKARVITKRAYGIKSADSLWTRLLLDLNRAAEMAHRSIEQMRTLSHRIQAVFCECYI